MTLLPRAAAWLRAAAFIAPCLVAAAAPALFHAFSADESEEPPARYELTIDGTTTTVVAKRSFEVTVGGATYRGSIEPLPTRELTFESFHFEYPEAMSFAHDNAFGATTWTLDGDSVTLIVFRFADPFTLEEMVEIQKEGLDELGETRLSAATLQLGQSEVEGTKIDLEADLFAFTTLVFPVEDAETTRLWFVLQDIRDDPDEPTEEFTALRDVLSESFGAVL